MINLAGLIMTDIPILWIMIAFVVFGGVCLYFTSYRYLLGYFLMGVIFWLLVEGLCWVATTFLGLSLSISYIIALGIVMMVGIWLFSWLSKTSEQLSTRERIEVGNRPMMEKNNSFHQRCIRHHATGESHH